MTPPTPKPEIVLGPAESPDITLADCEDLAELADAISFALEGAESVILDFRAQAGTRVAVPDAARVLRDELERRESSPRVRVHVSSEKVARIVAPLFEPGASLGQTAQFGNVRVEVTDRSVTEVSGDTVVNASNQRLWLGAGVSGALGRAAGPRLQQAMRALAPIGPRDIVETPAFEHTKVRSILHVPTVSGRAEDIQTAYVNVLRVATEKGYRRVVLPSLGTGSGGLDPRQGATLLRAEIEKISEGPAMTIILPLFSPALADLFAEILGAELPSPTKETHDKATRIHRA